MVVPDAAGVGRADSIDRNVGWNRNVLSRGSKDHHLHLLMNNERNGPWRESHQDLGATLAKLQCYNGGSQFLGSPTGSANQDEISRKWGGKDECRIEPLKNEVVRENVRNRSASLEE